MDYSYDNSSSPRGMVYAAPSSPMAGGNDERNTVYIGSNAGGQGGQKNSYVVQGGVQSQMGGYQVGSSPQAVSYQMQQPQSQGQQQMRQNTYQVQPNQQQQYNPGSYQQQQQGGGPQQGMMMGGGGQHQGQPNVIRAQVSPIPNQMDQITGNMGNLKIIGASSQNQPQMMTSQGDYQPGQPQVYSMQSSPQQQGYTPQPQMHQQGPQSVQVYSAQPQRNQQGGPQSYQVQPQSYTPQQTQQGSQMVQMSSQVPQQMGSNLPQVYNPNQQQRHQQPTGYNPNQGAPQQPMAYNPNQSPMQRPHSPQPQAYTPGPQGGPNGPQVYKPNQPQAYTPNQQQGLQGYTPQPQAYTSNQQPIGPQAYHPNQPAGGPGGTMSPQGFTPQSQPQQGPQGYTPQPQGYNPNQPGNIPQQPMGVSPQGRPIQQAPQSFQPQAYNPRQTGQNLPQQPSNAPKSFVIQPNPQADGGPPASQPGPGMNQPAQSRPQQPTQPRTQPKPPAPPGGGHQMMRGPQGDGDKPHKIREMPGSRRGSLSYDDSSDFHEPPMIVSHPKASITLNEGEPCSMTAKVKPAGDSSLQVEWFKNGKSLTASSRYDCTFDRGYAVLHFAYTNDDDSGDYYCVATNKLGREESTPCHLKVIPSFGVITETQLPEDSMIANLEAMESYLDNSYNFGRNDEEKPPQAPVFVKNLQPIMPMVENSPAHFECIIEPSNDSSLTVDWFKDDKPVTMGCRYNATLDRGFAIFDILYCYAEDSGSYYCVAKNKPGEVKSNVVPLICQAEGTIITKSALSKDSIAYLESLDNFNSDVCLTAFDRPDPEDTEALAAPNFVIQPIPVTACEGTPAKFLVKADGNPRPKVMWYINGDLIASSGAGGNWRIYQDGGISYLEFHRCSHPGTYEITIVASNSQGEARTNTTFVVENQPDFRPDLKHVAPENPFKKMMQLRHVDCTDELVSKMKKPKAGAVDLRKIERFSEHKGRYNKESEQAEVENLYSKVQQNLRTGRASVPPQVSENRPIPPKEPEILANQKTNNRATSQKPQPTQQNTSVQQSKPAQPQHSAVMNQQQNQQPVQMNQAPQNTVVQQQHQQPAQMNQAPQNTVVQQQNQQPVQMNQAPQNTIVQQQNQQPAQMNQVPQNTVVQQQHQQPAQLNQNQPQNFEQQNQQVQQNSSLQQIQQPAQMNQVPQNTAPQAQPQTMNQPMLQTAVELPIPNLIQESVDLETHNPIQAVEHEAVPDQTIYEM